jgi:hypothetical protein
MAGLDPAIQKEQRVFGWLGHAGQGGATMHRCARQNAA